MALGGTQMSSSSTSVFPTQTDQLPQPVATTTDGGDSGGMAQRGANYFFGFLITFVVLLLIFVGCGIGTRRRFMTRRQAMLFGGLEQWGSLGPDVAKERPKFYEHPVGEPTEEDQWRYTMPLSVTLLRQSKDTHSIDETQNLPETNDTEAAPDQPDRTIGNILQPPYARGIPSWIPMFHEHKRLSQHEPSEIEYGPPEALHIAVMIAMPSPSNLPPPIDDQRQADSARLPEVQIGTTMVPWHTELVSTS